VVSYYEDPRDLQDLVLFVGILDCYDRRLLYPMFGDAGTHHGHVEGKSKVDVLLNPRTSRVGQCTASLLGLLKSWTGGGPCRRPWLLLDVLAAPVSEEHYRR